MVGRSMTPSARIFSISYGSVMPASRIALSARVTQACEDLRSAGQRRLANLGVPPNDLTLGACLAFDVGGTERGSIE